MSYSYPYGPPSSGNIYQRSSSIDYESGAGSFNEPAPTRSTVRNRNNEPQAVSQRNLNGEASHGQGQSISDMRHGGGMSANGNSGFHQSDAPNVDGYIRPNYSQPGQDYNPNSVGQAPGISGQARPNHSESAQPSTDDDQSPPLNPQDYVGISLVGKKFKEVNPSAYYVEK